MIRKPNLTRKVVQGLQEACSLAEADLETQLSVEETGSDKEQVQATAKRLERVRTAQSWAFRMGWYLNARNAAQNKSCAGAQCEGCFECDRCREVKHGEPAQTIPPGQNSADGLTQQICHECFNPQTP